MRLFLILAAFTWSATAASGDAIWDIADRWTCKTTMHIVVNTDGSDPEFNTMSNQLTFDFVTREVSTRFSDARGKIGFQRYSESTWGQFNIVEVMWDGEAYPMIITGEGGQWWHTGGANWSRPGEKMLNTTYRCTPGDGS